MNRRTFLGQGAAASLLIARDARPGLAGPAALTSEVRDLNGAPALFLGGKPQHGLTYYHSKIANAADEIASFGKAGVGIVTTPVPIDMSADGAVDFTAADATIRAVLSANASALFLPRVAIYPPAWWIDRYPEECMAHADPATGTIKPSREVSMASRRWRDDLAPALEALVRHYEEQWSDKVVGYHLAGGGAHEWTYSWGQVLSDYGQAQRAAYRQWLRTRYGGDPAQLRAAWNQPAADFDAVEIPAPADRMRGAKAASLFDPARDRRMIDYNIFHSEVPAEAAIFFAARVKATLAALGRKKTCGVFYGYHVWNVDKPAWFHNSGHHGLARLLESPAIDFIAAPIFYQERYPGGSYLSQLPAGSVRARGKLFYSEDDTRPWLAPINEAPWVHRCPDRASTLETLKRNLAGTLADGGTQWWMDMMGSGWYRDPGLYEDIGALEKLANRHFAGDRSSVAQVAVIVSKETAPFFRHDAALTDALLGRQMMELAHGGAPFDVFLASDLETVFARPDSKQYRLVIFADTFYLTGDQRRAVRERVARDGRALLWIHAGGLLTDSAWSTEAAHEMTGIRAHLNPKDAPQSILVETALPGARVVYGVSAPVAPVLWGDDPQAEILGWLQQPYQPGLLARDFPTWRSIWSAAPALPAALLRAIYKRTGVHVYCDAGDQVIRTRNLLALHAFSDGDRTLRLPTHMTLNDAMTGKPLYRNTSEIRLHLRRGQTWLAATTEVARGRGDEIHSLAQ